MMPDFFAHLPAPNPRLTPQEVVKIQLDALQTNDLVPQDRGIRLAFEFASPANREAIGPIDRFIRLLKTPIYQAMIGFEEAVLDTMVLERRSAWQIVYLVHQDRRVSYIFMLSRQTKAPFTNLWMTDAVLLRPSV